MYKSMYIGHNEQKKVGPSKWKNVNYHDPLFSEEFIYSVQGGREFLH